MVLYIILSIACFLAPLFFQDCYPFLFFTHVPLMYLSLENDLSLKKSFFLGVIWGILVYLLHLYWLFVLFDEHGFGISRYVIWLLIVLWFALHSGLWMMSIFFFKRYTWFFSWLGITVFYYVYILQWSLWPAGSLDGYPFINPFIIMAYKPALVWSVGYLGFIGLFVFLIMLQLYLSLFFFHQRKEYFLGVCFCFLPFLSGFVGYKDLQIDHADIGYVQPWWHLSKDPMFCGYRMMHDITKMWYEDDVSCIVLPESTFPKDLLSYDCFIKGIGDCKGLLVILGAQGRDKEKRYNSCFVIKDGDVLYRYDKKHLLPLMERRSRLLDFLRFGNVLSKDSLFFSYGDNENDVIKINDIEYQLFLCSELFFESKKVKGLPVLFLCNDYWFCCEYIKRLVPLFVEYISLKYKVKILYATVSGKSNLS